MYVNSVNFVWRIFFLFLSLKCCFSMIISVCLKSKYMSLMCVRVNRLKVGWKHKITCLWLLWMNQLNFVFFHSNSTIAKLSEEIEFYGDIYFKSRTLNFLVVFFFEFLALNWILVILLAKNMPKTNLTCTAHWLANLTWISSANRFIHNIMFGFFGNPHFIWNKKTNIMFSFVKMK